MLTKMERKLKIFLENDDEYKKFTYLIGQDEYFDDAEKQPRFVIKIWDNNSSDNEKNLGMFNFKIDCHIRQYDKRIYFSIDCLYQYNGQRAFYWEINAKNGKANGEDIKSEFKAFLKDLVLEFATNRPISLFA